MSRRGNHAGFSPAAEGARSRTHARSFHLLCTLFQIPECTNAYLKFQFVAGEDWQLLDGLEEGITQAARVPEGTRTSPTTITVTAVTC